MDWAEAEEKRELEAAKRAAQEKEIKVTKEDMKWMDEQVKKDKEQFGEDFGEDLEVDFEE